MSVRAITLQGTPVLHQRAKEVDVAELGTPAFEELIRDMLDTMHALNGVGIAATQVGVGKRVFIAESSDGPIALVNPVFTDMSWKKVNGDEGCLSVPGKFDSVARAKTVKIEALALDGKKVSFTAKDFFARILQHELDHLDGKLFLDRIAEQRGEK